MKVAVVTPYFSEPEDILERCLSSVQSQSYSGTQHICVADGRPAATTLLSKVIHITIPNSGDVGTTPRNVGMLVAMAQGADAMTFLDADCWFEPQHIERMVGVMLGYDAPVVTVARNLRRPDGSFLALDTESNGRTFNDTNCILLRRDAYRLLDAWIFASRGEALIHDRLFWKRVAESGLKRAHVAEATVNYTTSFAAHYLSRREQPPAGAKIIVRTQEGLKVVPYLAT